MQQTIMMQWYPPNQKIRYFIFANKDYGDKFQKNMTEDTEERPIDDDIWCLQQVIKTNREDIINTQALYQYVEGGDINAKGIYKEALFEKLKKTGDLTEKDKLTKDHDGVAFIFLTFLGKLVDGEETLIIGNDSVKINDIVDVVKEVPTWHGKPKLFIIQADDTSLWPSGLGCKGGDQDQKVVPPRPPSMKKIPIDADRLIIKSTIPQKWADYIQGYKPYGHPEYPKDSQNVDERSPFLKEMRPSFLIQAFCDEVMENAKKLDLLSLTPSINGRVKGMIKECRDHKDVKDHKKMNEILDHLTYPLSTSTFTKHMEYLPIKHA